MRLAARAVAAGDRRRQWQRPARQAANRSRLFDQAGNVILNDIPDPFGVDTEVVEDEFVTYADDLTPRNAGKFGAFFLRNLESRLADHDNHPQDGVLHQLVGQKTLVIDSLGKLPDLSRRQQSCRAARRHLSTWIRFRRQVNGDPTVCLYGIRSAHRAFPLPPRYQIMFLRVAGVCFLARIGLTVATFSGS